ncbi:MAG TPA: hypothetical protein VN132_10255, partial [Bdellovibrio sp.]|nr:hypothetical protein [Bdellovibrio sp.]
MLNQRVIVRSRLDTSAEEKLKNSLQSLGAVQDLQLSRVFWLLEKKSGAFSALNIEKNLSRIFCDPISEDLSVGFPQFHDDKLYVEVRFLPGVTDNWARSATEALALLSSDVTTSWQDFDIEVHSGWQVEMKADLSQKHIEQNLFQSLANPLLNRVDIHHGTDLKKNNSLGGYHNYW